MLTETALSELTRVEHPETAAAHANIGGPGHGPLAGGAHYAAGKAAIEQLRRSWALELASEGVRVDCVAPGSTQTNAPGRRRVLSRRRDGTLAVTARTV
ncbi:SDR family NAD(P)-dependent oxidoreductase [Streptomyces sp. NPDC060030]|uniref:SDR family NAD(P)-dependent oxidoreductase n=1 Tax=Streptomyces sp. NPDC060030 TaxID=3347042 RepID=UPI00367AE025